MVRWADARVACDWGYLLDEANRRMADKSAQETADYTDERWPDFHADVKRYEEILSDGRVSTKFFDSRPSTVYGPTGNVIPTGSLRGKTQ